MAEYTGTFETGIVGNTVAIADAGSATAWDDRNFDATHGTLEYSSTEKYQTLSCKMAMSATPVGPYVAWDDSTLGTTLSELWGRVYMHHSGLPNTVHEFVSGFDTFVLKWRIRILSGGTVRCTTVLGDADGAVSIATGQWIRLEWHVINSATVGVVEAKLFNTADSTTPSETITLSNQNSGLKTDLLRIGERASTNASRTVYMDNILVNDTGYPGPFAAGTPSLIPIQPSLRW